MEDHVQREVYHESQQSGFCGLHSLNNLLQGSYFNVVDLSNIALQIDKEEQELLHEAFPIDSHQSNVALDGNFSFQTLKRALDFFALQTEILRLEHLEATEGFEALLCNLDQHWFAIRKINGIWFNLDSLKPKPQIISDFFLSAFLNQIVSEGYSVFAVFGELPSETMPGDGAWWDITRLTIAGHSGTGDDEAKELERAIQMSMEQL
jgi:ataxin-3